MRENVVEILVRARVPADLGAADVEHILEEVIGAGQYTCEVYDEVAVIVDFTVCEGKVVSTSGTDMECQVDFDDATYIGDDEDGVYYQVFKEDDGSYWMSAVVDCNTGCFCDGLITADGPYEYHTQASIAGLDAAAEWCGENGVDYGNDYCKLARMYGV